MSKAMSRQRGRGRGGGRGRGNEGRGNRGGRGRGKNKSQKANSNYTGTPSTGTVAKASIDVAKQQANRAKRRETQKAKVKNDQRWNLPTIKEVEQEESEDSDDTTSLVTDDNGDEIRIFYNNDDKGKSIPHSAGASATPNQPVSHDDNEAINEVEDIVCNDKESELIGSDHDGETHNTSSNGSEDARDPIIKRGVTLDKRGVTSDPTNAGPLTQQSKPRKSRKTKNKPAN